jgi:8-oxo-dGTP diphosphatase / 2-hydroxy-dATP diphosphatase
MSAGHKLLSLVHVRRGTDVLLGYKKRGFGAGKWNGFGGKCEAGETMEECARRETREEANIDVETMRLEGVIHFTYDTKDKVMEVHVFCAQGVLGEVAESEEMRPEWFAVADVPQLLDKMWADDKYWLPQLLAGDFGDDMFEAKFRFKGHEGPDSEVILEQELKRVPRPAAGVE